MTFATLPRAPHGARRAVASRLRPGARAPALAALALATAVLAPTPASAQSLPDLLSAIAQGGGWVSIPIEGGRGTMRTRAVPTAGMRLSGCMEIWGGHSGAFDVAVEDVYGNGSLRRNGARPAEDVPFDYRTGAWSQLDVNVRWTERRDTTLLVWVGLEGGRRSSRDPCEPVYGSPP